VFAAQALASLEGKTAAAWGAAYAGGMLLGGRLLARVSSAPELCGAVSGAMSAWSGGALRAYVASVGFGVVALGFALGARETLPRARRVRFSVRGSNPLGFLRLFRAFWAAPGRRTAADDGLGGGGEGEGGSTGEGGSEGGSQGGTAERAANGAAGGTGNGRLVAALAIILALQTVHDGEGDVWQVYGADVHGWQTRENALYGAAVGVASTTGGLLTGASVRRLGNRNHTLLWTLCTTASLLLFMLPSAGSRLATLSVLFCAAEDCMSAAVCARLVQAGGAAGLSQGQLAGDMHNLSAIVRVVGLFFFGRLYLVGVRVSLPSLPYLLCAATQLAACALVLALPRAWWSPNGSGSGRRKD
jgi:hypothetical protein